MVRWMLTVGIDALTLSASHVSLILKLTVPGTAECSLSCPLPSTVDDTEAEARVNSIRGQRVLFGRTSAWRV
jgi:hypothetical protein